MATVALVALTLALQAYSWWLLEGYQLADAVEYMERARAFMRSTEVIDSRTIRSFGFSAVLLPIFGVADLLHLADARPVVFAVRLLQMALGVGLVLSARRIGERLGGATAGLAAGFLVAANPIFLQYSVSPVSDVAAALCVARALLHLLEPMTSRRGRRVGLWCGLAMSMAYKTLPLTALLVGLVALRDWRVQRRWTLWFGAAFGLCLAAQAGIDKLVYREWGVSLVDYLLQNVGGVLTKALLLLGFPRGARWVYEKQWGAEHAAAAGSDPLQFQVQPWDWYLTHLTELLVLPVLALALLALAKTLARPRWSTGLPLACALAMVTIFHLKPSKEFRLWIPLLPLLLPLVGSAWSSLDTALRRRRGPRLACALALGAWIVAAGLQTLGQRNTRKFSDYWKAIAHVRRRVEEESAGTRHLRVASAYHWAVFLQEGPHLQLNKLADQLDGWAAMPDIMKEKVLGQLRTQDWFLTHLPILTNPEHRWLTRALNIWFEVEALFYDHDHAEELGPVLVLRRKLDDKTYDPRRHTLFDVLEGQDPQALRRELGFPEPVRLIRPAHKEEMWFLGARYEVLPGDGHGWLTTYLYNARPCLADYLMIDRLTTFDERAVWQNNHAPTYGVLPTSEWKPGWIVRESWPVVAAAEPFDWKKPFRPIGADYRRGDLIPAYLWVDLVTDYRVCRHCGEPLVLDKEHPHRCGGEKRLEESDGRMVVTGRLERARFGASEPVRVGELREALASPEGWRWNLDGQALVGRLFLPVHPAARLPDDGRPIPD